VGAPRLASVFQTNGCHQSISPVESPLQCSQTGCSQQAMIDKLQPKPFVRSPQYTAKYGTHSGGAPGGPQALCPPWAKNIPPQAPHRHSPKTTNASVRQTWQHRVCAVVDSSQRFHNNNNNNDNNKGRETQGPTYPLASACNNECLPKPKARLTTAFECHCLVRNIIYMNKRP
jgi:hypothetical protein